MKYFLFNIYFFNIKAASLADWILLVIYYGVTHMVIS